MKLTTFGNLKAGTLFAWKCNGKLTYYFKTKRLQVLGGDANSVCVMDDRDFMFFADPTEIYAIDMNPVLSVIQSQQEQT